MMETILLIIGSLLLVFVIFIFKNGKSQHKRNVKKSKSVLKKINSFQYEGQKINYLKKIDPFVFEELLLTAFEKKGYRIKRNKRYTNDGGIDGVIFKNEEKYLIQAKRYANHISLQHMRDFCLLTEEMKCKGFFVHTGKTGKMTKDHVKQIQNVEIISGNKLIELINILN